jgi:hypothetical protein
MDSEIPEIDEVVRVRSLNLRIVHPTNCRYASGRNLDHGGSRVSIHVGLLKGRVLSEPETIA